MRERLILGVAVLLIAALIAVPVVFAENDPEVPAGENQESTTTEGEDLLEEPQSQTTATSEDSDNQDEGQSESQAILQQEQATEEQQQEDNADEGEVKARAIFDRVQLTKDQQQEIDAILEQMQDLRKQLIDKYVEFGVIKEDKAEILKERMDTLRDRMKNGACFPRAGLGFKFRQFRRGQAHCFGNPKPQE